MKQIYTFLLSLMIIGSATASENKIVVSINPIHSLVASVTEGVGTPELLIKGAYSVHGYQTKPSDARMLESADVIVWVGPTMESTLIASVSNLHEDTKVIELGTMHGLQLYETRESPEGGHGHEDEDHGDSEGEGEEDHHGEEEGEDESEEDHHGEEDEDHGDSEVKTEDEEEEHGEEDEDHGDSEGEGEEDHHGEEEGEDEEDHHGEEEDEGEEDHHGEEEGHEHGRYDMHIWLDINNAKVIVEETAEQLAEVFPQHETQLMSNVNRTHERLDALEAELRSLSQSFAGLPYVVFHDAYQYLEKMLGLNNVGTVTVNPERAAGARRLLELRETIHETGATCVFKEPQFNPNTLEIIAEGTDLKIGTLDPLGADVEPGPNAYSEIMRNMVLSLKDCLG